MKDTRITPKVAQKTERVVLQAPGQRLTGLIEELTETETAIISAFRLSLAAESDWRAHDEKESWDFIKSMTHAIQDGDSNEDLAGLCDDEQFPSLLAAGMACAEAIKVMHKIWRKSRKEGIKRREAIENPD
jgi:uncharacterized protein YoaH (UPF0181 family)